MNKNSIAFLLLLTLSAAAFSQALDSNKVEFYPLLSARVDFLNIINPKDPSLLFSVEVSPFVRWMSVVQEAGIVVGLRLPYTEEIVSSFKYRSELHFFLDVTSDLRAYIGGDFQYRGLTIRDKYIFGYDCSGDDCVYYRKYEDELPIQRYTYQYRVGGQFWSNRFLFDVNVGIGQSYTKIDDASLSKGVIIEQNNYLNQSDLGWNYVITFSAKIGYIICWRRKKID